MEILAFHFIVFHEKSVDEQKKKTNMENSLNDRRRTTLQFINYNTDNDNDKSRRDMII